MAGKHNRGWFGSLNLFGSRNYSARHGSRGQTQYGRGFLHPVRQGRARDQLLTRANERGTYGIPASPRAHEAYPGRWGAWR